MHKRPLFWTGVCLLLTLVPIVNVTMILATTGADTLSNDYLMFVQQADRFLSGQHDWRLYFQDTLYTHVHSYAFLFPIRMLLLRLSHLSIYAEIYTGLLLAIARLLLFYRLLTVFLPAIPGRAWYRSPYLWLLPMLSALVFANAQITTFSYGETILQFGLTQLMILLGLLLLLRWPQRALAGWLAALCGLLASFSGGSGLMAWPVFLLAIFWRQRRCVVVYIAWLFGLLASAWPYLAYSDFSSLYSLQNPQLQPLLIGLGLPFANNINYGLQTHPQAQAIGLLGLFLAAGTLGLLWKLKPGVFACQAVPALLLMAWGLCYAVQVMLSRLMIAPWYTTSYSLFWLGALGLLPLLLDGKLLHPWQGWRVALPVGWGLGLSALLVLLYARSNLTYMDKSFYLASRSPASAACLRHYLNAPTYCEGLVFQWSQGNPVNLVQLGQLLARHQLSVFASQQEWTMQGDYVLGKVQWNPHSQSGLSGWASGDQDQPALWSDYHHLNALVPAGQSIRWQLDLPAGLRAAHFITSFSRSAGAICARGGDEFIFAVSLEDERGVIQPLMAPAALCQVNGWQPLEIDLTRYAGQQVTLIMATSNQGAYASHRTAETAAARDDSTLAARLRYPRLNLSGVPASSDWQTQARPSNTDLGAQVPITARAFRMPIDGEQGWQMEQLRPSIAPGQYVQMAAVSSASYALTAGEMCLTDWSQFYLQIAMSDNFRRKLVQVRFTYHSPVGPTGQAVLNLPLLASQELRTYTLNLNLLDAHPSACITKVELLFNYLSPPEDRYWIELKEAGFLARAAQFDTILH